MQIKRFEAKDMTGALAMIKQEFGPDAVILSAKSIRSYGVLGGAKTTGVEVTAAIDPSSKARPGQTVHGADAGDDVVTLSMAAARRRTGGRLMTSLNTGIAELKGRLGRSVPGDKVTATVPKTDGRLRRYLDGQGLNRLLTEKCLNRMGPAPKHLARTLADALEMEGVSAMPPQVRPAVPAVMVFVGPSGVGKTTSMIKLATRLAVDEQRRVGLVTLDHRRIGAVEQMQLFADILQVPMASVSDSKSFKQALTDQSGCEVILVDTPGIRPADAEAIASLQQLLKGARQAAVHLVMSVSAKEDDLEQALSGFQPLSVGSLVFTKFDESQSCGNVVNVLHRSRLPLAFITDGGDIPEDLHDGSVSWLTRRLMAEYGRAETSLQRPTLSMAATPHRPKKPRSPQTTDTDGQPFVANSNSDIFHRTDCKWTKMIKSENFISFDSIEDALSQGFNPCRYCKPTPSAARHRVMTAVGAEHMAGYR